MKRFKKNGIVIMVIIILITISVVASISKFNTPNFIMSGVGLVRVVFTKAEVVQIQSYPQIYLAKPDKAQQKLIDFMTQNGYQYLEDERMASTLVFGNEASKQYVDLNINKYFSKWVFTEYLTHTYINRYHEFVETILAEAIVYLIGMLKAKG